MSVDHFALRIGVSLCDLALCVGVSLGCLGLRVGVRLGLLGLGVGAGFGRLGLGIRALLRADARRAAFLRRDGALVLVGYQPLALDDHALGIGLAALHGNAALDGFDLHEARRFMRVLHFAHADDFRI